MAAVIEHALTYMPRERPIQAFSGDSINDGRSVEEFIEEVKRVLRAREQSREDQLDFILSLLRGPALDEVRLCLGDQPGQPSDIFGFLREAFGEKCSATQLLQTFYNRKQVDGKDLRQYSHALSQILSSIVKQSRASLPREKEMLRDQFIERLRDLALRRELRKFVRDNPQSNLLEVRSEAILWYMEDSKPQGPRVVKNRQVQYEVASEPQCAAIAVEKDHSDPLHAIQRTVAQQDKQIAKLGKNGSELTSVLKELTAFQAKQAVRASGRGPRSQPQYDTEGHPICFKCRGTGHIAKNCTQARSPQAKVIPEPPTMQEN